MFRGKKFLIGKYVIITYNGEWKSGRVIQGDGDFFLIEILSFEKHVMSLYNIEHMQQFDHMEDDKQVKFIFFRFKREMDDYIKFIESKYIKDENANIVPFVKK